MKAWNEAGVELAAAEGVYSLLLTGDEARATLRALDAVDDREAAAARDRLARLLSSRIPPTG
ncbi:hypothetical protein ACF08A_25715 [Streptomyces cellulosae]